VASGRSGKVEAILLASIPDFQKPSIAQPGFRKLDHIATHS
jgi:hypothetical protein